MFYGLQTTHSSVFQKHLLKSHEVSECEQHVKDVTWHLLFVLPAGGREKQRESNHICNRR